jgi:hypothetical protein
MEKNVFTTSASPEIILEAVEGDLSLKGRDQNEVVIKSSDEAAVEQAGERIVIRSPGDCTVYVPHAARVAVRRVGGDASLRALTSPLMVEQVGGEVFLRDVGPTQVEAIGTDLSAKRVRGDLSVKNVGRGAILRDIDGDFSAGSVGAHLNLRDVSGGVTAAVGGHADLSLAPVPWKSYQISAGGNITCRVTEDTQAVVNVSSGGRLIDIKVPGASQTLRQEAYTFTIGEGGPELRLTAGGVVEISSRAAGWGVGGSFEPEAEFGMNARQWEGMADQIEQQVSAHLDAVTGQLDSLLQGLQFTPGAGRFSEQDAERIRSRVEQARARAEEKSQRLRERLSARLEAARQRAAARPVRPPAPPAPAPPSGPGSRFVWPAAPSSAPAEDGEPVSEEERLLILRMLEEKKISAEEAEKLLAALEGRQD